MTCKPVVKVNLKSCIFLLSAILSIPITPLASAQLVSSGLSLVRPIVTPLVFSSSLFLPPVTYNTGGFDPSAIAVTVAFARTRSVAGGTAKTAVDRPAAAQTTG